MTFILVMVTAIYTYGLLHKLVTLNSAHRHHWSFSKLRKEAPASFSGKMFYWALSAAFITLFLPMYFPWLAAAVVSACIPVIFGAVL